MQGLVAHLDDKRSEATRPAQEGPPNSGGQSSIGTSALSAQTGPSPAAAGRTGEGEPGGGQANQDRVGNVPWQHPLAFGPVANVISGLFGSGNSGTKQVEGIFRILRRTQELKSEPLMDRFRAVTQQVRCCDPMHRSAQEMSEEKQKKVAAAKKREQIHKRMQDLGLGFGNWDACVDQVEEEGRDAAAVEEQVASVEAIRENEYVTANNPLVIRAGDWERSEEVLPDLLKKNGWTCIRGQVLRVRPVFACRTPNNTKSGVRAEDRHKVNQ